MYTNEAIAAFVPKIQKLIQLYSPNGLYNFKNIENKKGSLGAGSLKKKIGRIVDPIPITKMRI